MTRKLSWVPLSLLVAVIAGLLWPDPDRDANTIAAALASPTRVVVPRAEPVAAAGEHLVQATTSQSIQAMENALVSGDPAQRETAFNAVLPGLIANDPGALVELVARQPPGQVRDDLRDEVARQWVRYHRAAASAWMHSLADRDQRAAATVAMRALAAGSAPEAVAFADEFDIGRDDGSVPHIVQLWAVQHPGQTFPTQDGDGAGDGRRAVAE